MRQYYLYLKAAGSPEFVKLQPVVHASLYDKVEVRNAIEHMQNNTEIKAMIVETKTSKDQMRALEQQAYQIQIFAFEQEAEAPGAFKFEK